LNAGIFCDSHIAIFTKILSKYIIKIEKIIIIDGFSFILGIKYMGRYNKAVL
jgi:hypothetical protein